MPDPDDQNSSLFFSHSKDVQQQQHNHQPQLQPQRETLMDFDFDLDNSWPLDQIPFVSNSNPMSPLLIPTSSCEQPFSPLWAFSDSVVSVTDDDKLPAGQAHRIADYPRLISYAFDSGTENPAGDDDRKWIPPPFIGLMPIENSDGGFAIKEKMTRALRYFKESTGEHILAQIWAPVKNGGRYVLTTSGQPFVLDPNSNGLHQYRMVSLMYKFSADGENDRELGLPGRVFRQKFPEWTPNVQFYSDREFSRLNHALNYNVRGTLALPVFEPSGQACVGVLELIMTSQKINYAPELDKVCKALQAVNLKSSEILDHPAISQICNEGRQNALAEILEILTVVCETHKLPLAQTWVPCRHRSVLAQGGGLKKNCSSIDGSCMGQVCMSTTDVAYYIVDAHVWGFREACAEHHLQKGQGVAGRAFSSQNSCFCRDITKFCKTDYPLVHYARMFRLSGCFAICLRSSFTGDDDYVLEFFLPQDTRGDSEQQALLGSIMATMRQHFRSISVASGIDLEGERYIETVQATENGIIETTYELVSIPELVRSPSQPETSPVTAEMVRVELSQKQSAANMDVPNGGTGVNTLNNGHNIDNVNGSSNPVKLSEKKETKKTSERKRGKAEKTISLEVLQQYFSGSLKDAAKSLGVCPTTMKRICRQHGISRWPSRKINKVNRSLSKLNRVIESVQGTDGSFDLTSLASSPLQVAVGSSWAPGMNGTSQQNSPCSKPFEVREEKIDSVSCQTPVRDGLASLENHYLGARDINQEISRERERFTSVPDQLRVPNQSRSGSGSREDSPGTPTSRGSCQGSPANETAPARGSPANAHPSSIHEHCVKAGGSPELPFRPMPPSSIPETYFRAEPAFRGMLIEESGSSKDLKNLCPSAADAILDERVPESSWTNPPCPELTPKETTATLVTTCPPMSSRHDMKSMIVKATYKEDIIRFRIPSSCSIVFLKEEIAKRFKLEVGTFEIKYLDDDHEWVLIACDVDLQECMEIIWSSGSSTVRLLVHDISSNLGSSCESNGE